MNIFSMSDIEKENVKAESDNSGAGDSKVSQKTRKTPHLPPPKKSSWPIVLVIIGIFAVFIALMHFGQKSSTGSPVTVYTFERFTNGFKAVGRPEGKLSLAQNVPGADSKVLQYEYENDVDNFCGVGRMDTPLDGFKEIKLKICSKTDRTFVISVDEIDEASIYVYVFELKAGQWTDIVAKPLEFKLASSSTDSNGKLDNDRLSSRLVIADMSGFKGDIGPNAFWVSRVEIDRGDRSGSK